jgi:GntR family transcriptional regulator, transcriptional repressor for pyruvate dehydrogenase complex
MLMSEELFTKVVGERRYEAVVRQILTLIGQGEIEPGSRLPPERELAERLDVSRNVLREAFRVLEVRGIVRSHAGGGRYVRADNISPALPAEGIVLRLEEAVIVDVLEARRLLEVQIVRLAAERATAEQARELAHHTGDQWDDNIRFHCSIAAATGNFMLERLIRLQMELLRDVRQREHYRSAESAADLLAEHQAIAEAIAAHDPDTAEAAIRRHLAHTEAEVTDR